MIQALSPDQGRKKALGRCYMLLLSFAAEQRAARLAAEAAAPETTNTPEKETPLVPEHRRQEDKL